MHSSSRFDFALFALLCAINACVLIASPNSRALDWFHACKINEWTLEYVPVGRKGRPLCVNHLTRDRRSSLMRDMKERCPKDKLTRVCSATGFGAGVDLHYMYMRNEFLQNPVITHRDESYDVKWLKCRGEEKTPFHTAITVKYADSYDVERTTTFYEQDAMYLECALE